MSEEILADRFRGVGGVSEEFFSISKKLPFAKPVSTGSRPLQPNSVAESNRAESNDAGDRIPEKSGSKCCRLRDPTMMRMVNATEAANPMIVGFR